MLHSTKPWRNKDSFSRAPSVFKVTITFDKRQLILDNKSFQLVNLFFPIKKCNKKLHKLSKVVLKCQVISEALQKNYFLFLLTTSKAFTYGYFHLSKRYSCNISGTFAKKPSSNSNTVLRQPLGQNYNNST